MRSKTPRWPRPVARPGPTPRARARRAPGRLRHPAQASERSSNAGVGLRADPGVVLSQLALTFVRAAHRLCQLALTFVRAAHRLCQLALTFVRAAHRLCQLALTFGRAARRLCQLALTFVRAAHRLIRRHLPSSLRSSVQTPPAGARGARPPPVRGELGPRRCAGPAPPSARGAVGGCDASGVPDPAEQVLTEGGFRVRLDRVAACRVERPTPGVLLAPGERVVGAHRAAGVAGLVEPGQHPDPNSYRGPEVVPLVGP